VPPTPPVQSVARALSLIGRSRATLEGARKPASSTMMSSISMLAVLRGVSVPLYPMFPDQAETVAVPVTTVTPST